MLSAAPLYTFVPTTADPLTYWVDVQQYLISNADLCNLVRSSIGRYGRSNDARWPVACERVNAQRAVTLPRLLGGT